MLLYMCFLRGALTSKPYSFVARPWEFKSLNGVDFFDPAGSTIRVDVRGDTILRILPQTNSLINIEWISDKIRFVVDGLNKQRIDSPLINLRNTFLLTKWSKVIAFLTKLLLKDSHTFTSSKFLNFEDVNDNSRFNNNFVNYKFGSFSDLESEFLLNVFLNSFFFSKVKSNFFLSSTKFRDNFLLNLSLQDFFKFKTIILVGLNLRYVSPVLNIRLRQGVIRNIFIVFNFGLSFIGNYMTCFSGGIKTFTNLLNGLHWSNPSIFNKESFFLFGNSEFYNTVISKFKINSNNFKFSVMSKTTSELLNKEVGNFYLYNPELSFSKITPSLEIFNTLPSLFQTKQSNFFTSCTNREIKTVVNFSHHGDYRLKFSDIILPISSPFERDNMLLNVEGYVQKIKSLSTPPVYALDLKNLINIIVFSLLSAAANSNINVRLILNYSVVNLMLSVESNLIWFFINKFFILSKGKFSSLVMIEYLSFLLINLFYNGAAESKLLKLENKFTAVNTYKNTNIMTDKDFFLLNTLSNTILLPNYKYYTQDELSSSSKALIAAEERLSIRTTYN